MLEVSSSPHPFMRRLAPILLAALALAASSCMADKGSEPVPGPDNRDELVFLIHGLFRGKEHMAGMADYLRGEGYSVANFGYSSTNTTIERAAQEFHSELMLRAADPSIAKVHIVGHSMGCIVARQALLLGPPPNMGRVVMLGPPNHGSPWAAFAAPWLGGWIGALRELSDDEHSTVNRLGPLEGIDIGVIAASYDFLVPESSCHLPEERDFIVMKAMHVSLPFLRSVQDQVHRFLVTGAFDHRAQD